MTAPAEHSARRFSFERDTFAFAHELVWKYHFDPVTGAMTTCKTEPPPTYYHRCFVLVRAARLFFDYAYFAPELPQTAAPAYEKIIRKIIASNPRKSCAEENRIVIPGFDGLRSFSRAHENLLKANCGAAWESYFLRSHWRMIFKVYGRFQEKMAEKLKRSLQKRGVSLVHLFRFPNLPEYPVELVYEKKLKRFTFAPNIYWGGGVLSVMEIFCDFPY